MALSVGQSNHLVIPPVALAENISMEVRKDADNASRSTLADLCFAMCQVIDLCLVGKRGKRVLRAAEVTDLSDRPEPSTQ